MPDHTYDDAPLWTVLSALAVMPESEARMLDLARRIRTRSGIVGAYRAIGRLTSAGYAVIVEVADESSPGPQGRKARIRLTQLGLARYRAGADLVRVALVDRVNTSGGFGAVHRSHWIPRPGKTA